MHKQKLITFNWIFIKKDDKILLLRRKWNGKFDWFWWAPGWHLDVWETFMESALRETKEEIGITINKKDLSTPILVYKVDKEKNELFVGRYTICEKREGEIINNEPDKCSKLSRYNTKYFPREITPLAQRAFEWLQNRETYIEL